jgi:hypothetical protein
LFVSLWAEAMRPKLLICLAVLAAALAGPPPTLAQSADKDSAPAKAAPADDRATALSGLTVAVRRTPSVSELNVRAPVCPKMHSSIDTPPKLVSTYPARGTTIRPGLMVLRLTFDKPMMCGGVLGADGIRANPCPPPLEDPLYSRDRRTFLTVCRIDGNGAYGLKLTGFTSVTGQQADTANLSFQTSGDAPVASAEEALARDEWMKTGGKATR